MTRARRVVVAVAASYAVAFLVTADSHALLRRVFDDTFYFLKIAENVSRGHGASFDGIHATNGFQPLWMVLLVPVFTLVHGSREEMIRWVLAVQFALLAGTMWLLIQTLRRLIDPASVLVGVIIATCLALHPAWNGMESALVLFCLAALFYYGHAADVFGTGGPLSWLTFGLLLGSLFLARVDTVFIGLPIATVALFGGDRPPVQRLERALLVGLGASLPVAPYLLWNLRETGSLMPISGMLKSTFPHVSFEASRVGRFGVRYLLCLLLSAGLLAREGWHQWRGRAQTPGPRYLDVALAVGSVAVWLHALHSILFMRWAVFRWHHIWYGLVGAFIVAWAFARARQAWSLPRRPAVVGVLLVAALGGGAAEVFRQDFLVGRNRWHEAAYVAARWAGAHTAPGSVFGMYDAGAFGFFSDRSVINLDGVVNDRAYQERLRDGQLDGYLRDNQVSYLVSHEVGKREDLRNYGRTFLRVRSQLYPGILDSVEVRQEDEVYRSAPYPHEGRHEVCFVVWEWSDRNLDP